MSLGGFSSILIEGNIDRLSGHGGTVFTTGNSLTFAFIVQGLERVCVLEERDLRSATRLIVGATGDIGSGAARCLAPRVKRASAPPHTQSGASSHLGSGVEFSRGHGRCCPEPAASSRLCRPHDLRGKSLLTVAAAIGHRSRIDCLRRRISEESLSRFQRGESVLGRAGASNRRHDLRARYS